MSNVSKIKRDIKKMDNNLLELYKQFLVKHIKFLKKKVTI